MLRVWVVAITLSLTLSITHAFPEGVPLNACTKQMVDAIPPYAHLVKTTVYNVSCYPQNVNLTGGFVYTFSSNTWKAGEPLSLNITDTTGVGIRGFFFQAFDSARSRVGTWTFSPYPFNASFIQGQIINCPDGQAVAHTGVLGNSKKGLRPHYLQLNVTIPKAGVGPIEVAGIVLTDRTIWYLDNLQIIDEAAEPANTPTEVAPTPPTTMAPISTAEVALHNNAASCWTIYNGWVYDQTYWVPYHPGPGGISIMQCGQDGTNAYATFTNLHNMSRINLYTAMVGPVSDAAVVTTGAPGSTSTSTATASATVSFSTSIVIILVIGAVAAVGLLAVGIFRALNPSAPSNVQLSRTAQMINKQTTV